MKIPTQVEIDEKTLDASVRKLVQKLKRQICSLKKKITHRDEQISYLEINLRAHQRDVDAANYLRRLLRDLIKEVEAFHESDS